MALATLQQRGELAEKVAGFALAVCVLGQARAGVAGAFLDDTTARAATALSGRRGYLDGRALAEVFAWLRPDDLIWTYWVNNYLQGRDPAPFDILFWNADTTRMTAALHRDLLDLALRNALMRPGEASMLGEPATYQVSNDLHAEPAAWQRATTMTRGSWWPDYLAWLSARSGPDRDAPDAPGGAGSTPLDPAPGVYVPSDERRRSPDYSAGRRGRAAAAHPHPAG
jgi:polyhydroxyalkanoate synthase